jgi:hypothetical protein
MHRRASPYQSRDQYQSRDRKGAGIRGAWSETDNGTATAEHEQENNKALPRAATECGSCVFLPKTPVGRVRM